MFSIEVPTYKRISIHKMKQKFQRLFLTIYRGLYFTPSLLLVYRIVGILDAFLPTYLSILLLISCKISLNTIHRCHHLIEIN